MKLTTRNGTYFLILITLCLVSFWYFSRDDKYIENLDEMYEIGTNCDGPFGCKTPEEMKKEGKAELKKQQTELAKPPSSPPNIADIKLQFTIENQTPTTQSIKYNLPAKPKNPYLGGTMAGYAKLFDFTKPLIESKVLSSTKSDVYMLDVDPKSVGVIDEPSYSVTTLSVNHPDNKLPTSTFDEYIPRNKSLNEIYNNKKKYINEVDSKITISNNTAYSEYTENRNSNINIKLDKAKPNNNFIIITPTTKDMFPKKFQLEITNNTKQTNQMINLWGDFFSNKSKSQPDGNPNRILTTDDISNYTEKGSRTVFGYNKDAFGESCKKLDESECEIAGMDVGNKCINIIQSGNIYDETGDKIGSASISDATEAKPEQKIIINIDSDNVTGLLIYTSYLM